MKKKIAGIQTIGKRDPKTEERILKQQKCADALAKRPNKAIELFTLKEREAAISAMLEWWLSYDA
jgi:hypothetical protein